MNGKEREQESLTDDAPDDTSTDTVVLTDDDSDIAIGNSTVEMDIEKLVKKLDAIDSEDVHRKAEMRHKLEELQERHEQELDSTFNLKFDDDE